MSKGDVSTKDMFPSPTIYDDPAVPAKKFPADKVAEFLGLHEGEVGIIIVGKRESGGHDFATSVTKDTSDRSLLIDVNSLMKDFIWARIKK